MDPIHFHRGRAFLRELTGSSLSGSLGDQDISAAILSDFADAESGEILQALMGAIIEGSTLIVRIINDWAEREVAIETGIKLALNPDEWTTDQQLQVAQQSRRIWAMYVESSRMAEDELTRLLQPDVSEEE